VSTRTWWIPVPRTEPPATRRPFPPGPVPDPPAPPGPAPVPPWPGLRERSLTGRGGRARFGAGAAAPLSRGAGARRRSRGAGAAARGAGAGAGRAGERAHRPSWSTTPTDASACRPAAGAAAQGKAARPGPRHTRGSPARSATDWPGAEAPSYGVAVDQIFSVPPGGGRRMADCPCGLSPCRSRADAEQVKGYDDKSPQAVKHWTGDRHRHARPFSRFVQDSARRPHRPCPAPGISTPPTAGC